MTIQISVQFKTNQDQKMTCTKLFRYNEIAKTRMKIKTKEHEINNHNKWEENELT